MAPELLGNDLAPSNRTRCYIDGLAGRVANKIGCSPGENLVNIVEKRLGGRVEVLAPEEGEQSIKVAGEGEFTIFLSPYNSRLRNRFTIAHELGHYFLHSVMGEQPLHIFEEGEGREESEADWFAMGLLMPEEEFREAAIGGSTAEELAARFDVSVPMIRIRKQSLGI